MEKIGNIYDDGVVDEQGFKTVNDVLEHKSRISKKLMRVSKDLEWRAQHHDESKLKLPEVEMLIKMDKEPRHKYGSPEYFEKQKKFKEFFLHHYKMNSHHPEHFEYGIEGMDCVDLIEMCADWTSYLEKMSVTEALKVLEAQKERYKIDDSLFEVIKNTVLNYFAWLGDYAPPEHPSNVNEDKDSQHFAKYS